MDFILGSLDIKNLFLNYDILEKIAKDSINYSTLDNPAVSNFITEEYNAVKANFELNWDAPPQSINSFTVYNSSLPISSRNIFKNTSTTVKGVPPKNIYISREMLREKLSNNINRLSQYSPEILTLPAIQEFLREKNTISFYDLSILFQTIEKIINEKYEEKERENYTQRVSEFNTSLEEAKTKEQINALNEALIREKFTKVPFSKAKKYRNTIINSSKKLRNRLRSYLKKFPTNTTNFKEITKDLVKFQRQNSTTRNIILSEVKDYFHLEDEDEKLQEIGETLYDKYKKELSGGGKKTFKKKRKI
jgi:hypothetical protein